MDIDIIVADFGSLVRLTPLSDAGSNWINANVYVEGWQWLGGGLCVERRFVPDLISGMNDDGLVVSADWRH